MLTASPIILNFLAGILSILSPCVFPVIPFLVGSALQEHKMGPVAISLGLVTSFCLSTILLITIGSAIGLEQSALQKVGAVLLIGMGLIYLIPITQNLFEKNLRKFSNLGNRIIHNSGYRGLKGQFIIGLLLGTVWAPCVGPAYGTALALATSSSTRVIGITSIFSFTIGIIIPILLFSYGLRKYSINRLFIIKLAAYMKYLLGITMLILGIFILLGLNKYFEEIAINHMPIWLLKIITFF
jgi:cytochrome c biogenesis protein CcdA